MSSNLDVVRSIYSAFAVGDIPSVLATFSPAIHWTEAEGGPYGGIFVGPEAVLKNAVRACVEAAGWKGNIVPSVHGYRCPPASAASIATAQPAAANFRFSRSLVDPPRDRVPRVLIDPLCFLNG